MHALIVTVVDLQEKKNAWRVWTRYSFEHMILQKLTNQNVSAAKLDLSLVFSHQTKVCF